MKDEVKLQILLDNLNEIHTVRSVNEFNKIIKHSFSKYLDVEFKKFKTDGLHVVFDNPDKPIIIHVKKTFNRKDFFQLIGISQKDIRYIDMLCKECEYLLEKFETKQVYINNRNKVKIII